jgi:hypothetical protein
VSRSSTVDLELDHERFVTRPEGRRAWLREGRRALEAQRDQEVLQIPRGREERIVEVKRRFTHAANRCYEQHRATGRMPDGRCRATTPKPRSPTAIVVAAEVTTTAPDYGQLEPVVRAALRDLGRAGVTDTPVTVLADAGYRHKEQMERIIPDGMQVLVPPDSGVREAPVPAGRAGSTRS